MKMLEKIDRALNVIIIAECITSVIVPFMLIWRVLV